MRPHGLVALVLLALGACNGDGTPDRPGDAGPDAAMSGPPDASPGDAPAAADAGSSVDAGPPGDDAPPSSGPAVVATVPADQASGVEPGATIEVTFSRDMAADTIDTSTIVVTRGGVAVPGAVSYDAATRTATFRPQARMALLTEHTVTVTTGVTDVDGAPLPAERAWRFTVRDGAWSAARPLLDDPEGSGAPSPQAAIGAGDGLVLWERDGGVWGARHRLGTGWDAAEVFAASAFAPRLAMTASGHGAALFNRGSGGTWSINSLWIRHLAPGGAWSAAELVESDDAYAHHVGELTDVAIDPSGAATVAWDQYGDTIKSVWARRFSPGRGWDSPVVLETQDARQAGNPRVAVDPDGNAVVAWMQPDDTFTDSDIWTSRYVAGTGWSIATPLSSAGAGFASRVRLAADLAGNVTAVWNEHDGTRDSVWSNRYVAGAGWGTATLLETSDGFARDPALAVDAAGNVTVVWYQRGDDSLEVWARRFEPGAGWTAATRVAAGASPDVVADPAGNVIVVWTQGPSTQNLWARRYVPGVGWGTATEIDAGDVGDSFFADLAIGPLGTAVVAWTRSVGESQSGSEFRVWGAAFE